MAQDSETDFKKMSGTKKTRAQKWPSRTFFLGSAWDYGGMIDYSLTFTKRGWKPYLTLTDREIYNIFKTSFLAVVIDRTMALYWYIFIIIGRICRINSKLAFQGYFWN